MKIKKMPPDEFGGIFACYVNEGFLIFINTRFNRRMAHLHKNEFKKCSF